MSYFITGLIIGFVAGISFIGTFISHYENKYKDNVSECGYKEYLMFLKEHSKSVEG